MVTTVIFDVDGTLVDSTPLHALAWKRAINAHGFEIATWRVQWAIGMGGDKLVPALLGEEVEEREGDSLRAASATEFRRLAPFVTPLPGAAELVRSVRERGMRVAIASSGSSTDVEESLARAGVTDLADSITTGDDVDESKPEPDLVAAAVRAVGAATAVMVGDTPYDATAAGRIGVPCVALRSGGFCDADLRGAGAIEIFDEPRDAIEFDWSAAARPPRLD